MVVLLQQDSPPPPQMFWQKEVASTYISTRKSQGSWKKKHKLRVNFYPDFKVALPKKRDG